jgi:hypothetical protein
MNWYHVSRPNNLEADGQDNLAIKEKTGVLMVNGKAYPQPIP